MTKSFINFLKNIYSMQEVSQVYWEAGKVGVGGDCRDKFVFASDPDFAFIGGAFDVVTFWRQLCVTRGGQRTPRGFDCASLKSGKNLSVDLVLLESDKNQSLIIPPRPYQHKAYKAFAAFAKP